jgi:hypothetical protein
MPLHVSSSKCSSSGGPNYINTPSGITYSGEWLSAVPAKRKCFKHKCSSSGGPNCINTSSGITHSDRWLSGVPVKRKCFEHKCSSSGGPNCFNTSSGITHSDGWLPCRPRGSFPLAGTADSHSPEYVIPNGVLIEFGPPDDENLLLETCRGVK